MCIVVLGNDLCIRRFTPLAEKIFNLVPTDVGRPITNIKPNIDLPDLEETMHAAINSARPAESDVQDKDGRWYSFRIFPYRTLDNRIDGVLIVLVDIHALKRSEQVIKAARDYAESTVEVIRNPLLILNENLGIERANQAFYKLFKVSPAEIEGHSVFEIEDGRWNIFKLRTYLQDVLPRNSSFDDLEVDREFDRIGHRTVLLSGSAERKEQAYSRQSSHHGRLRSNE